MLLPVYTTAALCGFRQYVRLTTLSLFLFLMNSSKNIETSPRSQGTAHFPLLHGSSVHIGPAGCTLQTVLCCLPLSSFTGADG